MRILVGGETRKCGKTSLVCRIVGWFPEKRWAAVKVSGHRHEEAHPRGGDTARFLEAGAGEAWLVEAGGEDAARLVEESVRGWEAVCVEGTGVGAWMEADVRLMVRGGGEAKESAADAVFRPDAYVGEARPGDERPSFGAESEELRRFLAERWK